MSDSELAVVSADSFATPTIITRAGPTTRKKFFEFFTVPIRNANTRAAYYRAIQQFLAWADRAGYQDLEDLEPITVAAYIEILQRRAAPPTVKQHMAAIRMLFSWLTEKGVLAMNPAREVKTERFSRTEGKTPAFVEGEVQRLLEVIETSTHTSLRDRALLGVLAYTFARIGAVVNLKVEDYYPSGKRFLLRFKEKGGKEKELPVHHKLEELLDEYLKATGLGTEPGSPLFPAALGKTGKLSRRPLVRTDAADMLKRRLKQAGLPAHYSPHSFRATGITNFLENDGTLEAAQRIASRDLSPSYRLHAPPPSNYATEFMRTAPDTTSTTVLTYESARSIRLL
jgi:integrase/recombinase XerD